MLFFPFSCYYIFSSTTLNLSFKNKMQAEQIVRVELISKPREAIFSGQPISLLSATPVTLSQLSSHSARCSGRTAQSRRSCSTIRCESAQAGALSAGCKTAEFAPSLQAVHVAAPLLDQTQSSWQCYFSFQCWRYWTCTKRAACEFPVPPGNSCLPQVVQEMFVQVPAVTQGLM